MAFADFDQAYDPINPTSRGEGATSQTYVMGPGDTLRSVAQAVWGDGSLWYLIADANGLVGSESLMTGTRLSIPAKVTNLHNKSSTFRVYDPNERLGDVDPSKPAQVAPPKRKDCGGLGPILIAIVAIVVALVVAPYATAAISNAFAGVGASVERVGRRNRYPLPPDAL